MLARSEANVRRQRASRSFVNTSSPSSRQSCSQVLQEDRHDRRLQRGKHCRRKWTTIDLSDSCLISSPLFLLVPTESLLNGAVTVGACMFVKYPQVKRCTHTPSYRRKPLLYTRASWVVLLEEGNCSPVIFLNDRPCTQLKSTEKEIELREKKNITER